MTSNRFYLASSMCFVVGAVLALREMTSASNWMYLAGSLLFFTAAAVAMADSKSSR